MSLSEGFPTKTVCFQEYLKWTQQCLKYCKAVKTKQKREKKVGSDSI